MAAGQDQGWGDRITDMPRLLAGEWGSFAKAVWISDAPPLQMRDMKRCFMAGARAY